LKTHASHGPVEVARLSGLVEEALHRFCRLTGLTAVASLGMPGTPRHPRSPLPPLVHSHRARELRGDGRVPPCGAEWRKHLRSTIRAGQRRHHVCPLGLRCATVPIQRDGVVFGLVKSVSSLEVPEERFVLSVRLLEVLLEQSCQRLETIVLTREVRHLRVLNKALERTHRVMKPPEDEKICSRSRGRSESEPEVLGMHPAVVRILEYLNDHYFEPDLDLVRIAQRVGRNEKYLAHLFVRNVGVRMRAYITTLRLRHACELMITSPGAIDQIARESGYSHIAHFQRVFRRTFGVTPARYRRIFTSGA
jgi:AraC-like DNA-binding protein